MSKMRLCSWLLIVGLSVVVQFGCGGVDSCKAPVGDFAVYGADFSTASVAWALDTVPMHSATVGPETPAVGDCQLWIVPGRLPSPSNTSPCLDDRSFEMLLDCVVTNENLRKPIERDPVARWMVSFGGFGDSRTWAVGELDPSQVFRTETYPRYLQTSLGCQGASSGSGQNSGVRVFVEEAAGVIAEYPQVVKPDYLRVFRLEFHESLTLSCGVAATMDASLRFTQTAANYAVTSQFCVACK
jgi:hypothetical protein